MSLDSRERYYVKESTGFPVRPGRGVTGNSRLVTEVLVLDRDYCHQVVWSSLDQFKNARRNSGAHTQQLSTLRAEAHRLAEQWNAEDRIEATA